MNINELKRVAYEFRQAVKIFVKEYAKTDGISDSDLMEVSRIYPTYDDYVKSGQKIKAGTVIRDGVNAVGDPQLYRTVLETAPRADMRPAKIATSFEVPVPLFVDQGDKIEIDTRTGEYKKRV